MGTPTQVYVWSCPNFSVPAGRPFRVNHTVETDLVKLVVKIECFGKNFDGIDKRTGSSDGLQPKQAVLSYVHALNEPHLHEMHVVPSKHEADQYADLLEFIQQSIYQLADNDRSSLIPPAVLRVLNSKACKAGSGYMGRNYGSVVKKCCKVQAEKSNDEADHFGSIQFRKSLNFTDSKSDDEADHFDSIQFRKSSTLEYKFES
ncbi:hypothetical protein Tco_1147694 [Tanacetum coccineum]